MSAIYLDAFESECSRTELTLMNFNFFFWKLPVKSIYWGKKNLPKKKKPFEKYISNIK
jgi:hypothetical protein